MKHFFLSLAFVLCNAAVLLQAQPILSETWLSIGPFGAPLRNNDVISGHVKAIAVDPRNANTIYIGAAHGGVWKTTDGGGTWKSLTDFQLVRRVFDSPGRATLKMGSLAIDPSAPETVYAGTSGLGVFRTTDGGDTWHVAGNDPLRCGNVVMSFAVVNRMVFAPGNPTKIYAATDFGVYSYVNDGSDCWRQLESGAPAGKKAIDLTVDHSRGVVYVAFWSQGIYSSPDPGTIPWTRLTEGLPVDGFGRIAVAFGGRSIGLSTVRPIVYAGFEMNDRGYRLFKTVNGGASWTELPSPPSQEQLYWNNVISVGPYSSDDVWIGQVAVWRASDGGARGGLNNYKDSAPTTGNSWYNLSCCLVDKSVNPFRLGMDLHADIHDIVFAPTGSFTPSPSQLQMVFIATDGGITKGVVNSEGLVSWQPLTQGLAIGEIGTIGLNPRIPAETVAGLWHNGTIRTLTGIPYAFAVGGGDGRYATIDAGSDYIVFYDCNRGFGGEICRDRYSLYGSSVGTGLIWNEKETVGFWSDPYRPGHLLRLQESTGILFRARDAATQTAQVLNLVDWDFVDPLFGKAGKTVTMAFRSARLEAQPVYYIGTDRGQIWRGSPETPWRKVCDCGPSSVIAIAPDLVMNERIFLVLAEGPGRVKELTSRPNGSWSVVDIDSSFIPELRLRSITSIVVDPLVSGDNGTTIYVGTDLGIYRGHRPSRPQVIERSLVGPTPFTWTWTRSSGVPNVPVTDMEVHQSLYYGDQAGIIRAGTAGRGVFELRRRTSGTNQVTPFDLDVVALQMPEDGTPIPIKVKIGVVIGSSNLVKDSPLQVSPSRSDELTLEAPLEVRTDKHILRFSGWVISGKRQGSGNRVTVTFGEANKATAFYEVKASLANARSKKLSVQLSASSEQLCTQNLTHRLTVNWEITGGLEPVILKSEMLYPDGHVETYGVKFQKGSAQYLLSSPLGGTITFKLKATDSKNISRSEETIINVKPCMAKSEITP